MLIKLAPAVTAPAPAERVIAAGVKNYHVKVVPRVVAYDKGEFIFRGIKAGQFSKISVLLSEENCRKQDEG